MKQGRVWDSCLWCAARRKKRRGLCFDAFLARMANRSGGGRGVRLFSFFVWDQNCGLCDPHRDTGTRGGLLLEDQKLIGPKQRQLSEPCLPLPRLPFSSLPPSYTHSVDRWQISVCVPPFSLLDWGMLSKVAQSLSSPLSSLFLSPFLSHIFLLSLPLIRAIFSVSQALTIEKFMFVSDPLSEQSVLSLT